MPSYVSAPVPIKIEIAIETLPWLDALRRAGYELLCLTVEEMERNTEALLSAFTSRPPDVLLVDLSRAHDCLPLIHTRRLLRHVWGDDLPLPVCLALFAPVHLSQPDWPAHTDDFLLPPYAANELLARLTLLRFRRRHVPTDNLVRFADLILDLDSKRALDSDRCLLPLTPREYELLEFLVTHRGRYFPRARLLDLVWGIHFEGGERTVDIHIRRLRAKLPPQVAARLQTRRGAGYGLETS